MVHVTLDLRRSQFLGHKIAENNKILNSPIVGRELGPGNLSEAPLSSRQPPFGEFVIKTVSTPPSFPYFVSKLPEDHIDLRGGIHSQASVPLC